jgi:hypothetical protein
MELPRCLNDDTGLSQIATKRAEDFAFGLVGGPDAVPPSPDRSDKVELKALQAGAGRRQEEHRLVVDNDDIVPLRSR